MARILSLIFLLHLLHSIEAAVVPSNPVSLHQPGATLFQAPTNASSSPASPLHANPFPIVYPVPYTDPLLGFKIPNQKPIIVIESYDLTKLIVYGLNKLVEQCVAHPSDVPIPATGLGFGQGPIAISVKASFVGGLTFGLTASILRGVWEMLATYGSFTMAADIYIGGFTPGFRRGQVAVYARVKGSNATLDGYAPLFMDTMD